MAQRLEHFQQPALGVLTSLVEFLYVGSLRTQCFVAFGSATEKMEKHHQISGERVSNVFGGMIHNTPSINEIGHMKINNHKHIEQKKHSVVGGLVSLG